MIKVCAAVLLVLLASCAGKETRTTPEQGVPSGAAGSVTMVPQTAAHETYPFVGSANVNRYRFDNGLRLLVVEDHSLQTFAYQTWFRVGSRDEQVGRTGLAHLFEHLMFKRTRALRDGEFDSTLDANGAEGVDAFTDRDVTAYVQQLPAEKLELIVRLEAERMANLVVDEQTFTSESRMIRDEERYRDENNPTVMLERDLFELAFTKSPYHRPVFGYPEDLNRMSGEDARTFYRTWYSPNHATIVVVGDIDPETVRALVQKHYGALAGHASPPGISTLEPGQESPRLEQRSLDIEVEKLMIGYHVPGAASDETPALEVLRALLTGDNRSRLHHALVETGIASSTEAQCPADLEPTLFVVSASMRTGRTAAEAESVIVHELARVANEPIPSAELARAKHRADSDFHAGLTSDMSRARFLGRFESVAGDFRIGLNHGARIRTLTSADVQAVARTYLGSSKRNVIAGVPR